MPALTGAASWPEPVTLFTMVADQDLAKRIYRSLGDKKLEACLAETLGGES